MWALTQGIVDVISQLTQTLVAIFGAWLGWKTFIKEEDQEAETIETSQAINSEITDIKIFETSKQTTTLKKTTSGIECHLDDRRSGKRQGNRWTLSPKMAKEILVSNDIYVNPGIKLRTGFISIGTHRNWLYSKKLFPEPSLLHHRIIELLQSVALEENQQ